MMLTDLLLSPATGSNTARTTIIYPISRQIAESVGSTPTNEPRKLGAYFTILTYVVSQGTAALFLTATGGTTGMPKAVMWPMDQAWQAFSIGVWQRPPGTPPLVAQLDRSDVLPSAALTWSYSDNAQLRFGYNETVSRPEFRELSTAPFTDPLLDITVFGNPDLQPETAVGFDVGYERRLGRRGVAGRLFGERDD